MTKKTLEPYRVKDPIARIDSMIDEVVSYGIYYNGSPRITAVSLIRALGSIKSDVIAERADRLRESVGTDE